MYPDLSSFIHELQRRGQLTTISAAVDPHLELAEIHRRVISQGGSALLFRNVNGSSIPVVSNLFGTRERAELAFGQSAKRFVEDAVDLVQHSLPPTLKTLWSKRELLCRSLRLGTVAKNNTALREKSPVDLTSLPLTTSWPLDGGPFLTLPLVYTEDPETAVHNLGIYRMQRFDQSHLGLHMQIGKGGGFHFHKAESRNERLPVNVFLGGPPAMILAAIAPLPENVPELLLASLALGSKIPMHKPHGNVLPILSSAEIVLSGHANPHERRAEGPFGDHYGYYSLTHDFPVFHCTRMYVRENAVLPITVVGKPRQEDFFIGDYLQELLSPLFPLVMPAVVDLWSYGETGFHSLASAIVRERYARESLMSVFRILGEGQLSLTKFLIISDGSVNLRDFRAVLTYVLERTNFQTDLFVFANLSMDTLDYTGTALNHGSKGALLGLGEKRRALKEVFDGLLPTGLKHVIAFCPGCLVVSGESYAAAPDTASAIAQIEEFSQWPLIILCDNALDVTESSSAFLWHVFTRFDPASDIYAKQVDLVHLHPSFTPPIVIDCRMKPNYPAVVECDTETRALVDRRWNEYFPKS